MKNSHNFSPFIFPLLSLITGIYTQSIISIPTFPTIVFFLFCACGLLIKKIRLFALLGIFFCAGILILPMQRTHAEQLLATIKNQKLTLLATVTNRHLQATTMPIEKQNEILDLAISKFQNEDTQIIAPAKFNLQCFVKHTTKSQVGDTILIKDITIKPPQKNTLSGNPGYGDYLLKEGFLASIFLASAYQLEIVNRPTWSIKRWIWSLRNNTFQKIITKLSLCSSSYYSLIFLGKKDPSRTDQLRRTFNLWGLSHYLARSGLHIVLFILIWMFILSFFPIHLTIKRILLILICGTYGVLSWSSTPFIRAFYSFLLGEIGRIFNFNVHFFHILTITCLLMLLFNPIQLFFLDFQLTFGITFALAWLSLHTNTQKK